MLVLLTFTSLSGTTNTYKALILHHFTLQSIDKTLVLLFLNAFQGSHCNLWELPIKDLSGLHLHNKLW